MAAPTELAVFNVEGVHQTAGYWSLLKASQKIMKTTFQHLKLFISDEVSMISNLNTAYWYWCLKGVFGTDNWFGSTNSFFVGDLLQLPLVNGASV